jgi:threonine/homoserine/homoserine lactone efflux protein
VVPVALSLDQATLTTWRLLRVPTTVLVPLMIGSAFVACAARTQHLLRSQNAQKAIFKTPAFIMAISALGMLPNVC